jgi:hypothetical protein
VNEPLKRAEPQSVALDWRFRPNLKTKKADAMGNLRWFSMASAYCSTRLSIGIEIRFFSFPN